LVGVAAGVHLLHRTIDGQLARMLVAAVALTAVSIWLPLPCACLLAGIFATEAMLADNRRVQLGRIAAAALCLQIILFTLNYRLPPIIDGNNSVVIAGLLCLIVLIGFSRRQTTADPLICALLALIFLAFALTVKLLSLHLDLYPQVVAISAAGFCAAIAAISLVLAPLTGGGLTSQAFALDVPVDKWVEKISAIAAEKESAADFLEATMRELADSLPGITGLAWRIGDNVPQQVGRESKYRAQVASPPLTLTFYSRRFVSPWMWFGRYLLCRIVSEYYVAKRREEEQRAQNLLVAVHQTGARLTHDIKNILHALAVLTMVKDDALLRRQLPILRQRLETAVAKLQNQDDDDRFADAATWWRDAASRHLHTKAYFVPTTAISMVSSALFDRALDNFLENALHKQVTTITASLSETAPGQMTLRVTDDGAPVVAVTAAHLFAAPVQSDSGFGVALHQLAMEAEKKGYRAALEKNISGEVTFALLSQ
jgi:signal transduction histidine kinase